MFPNTIQTPGLRWKRKRRFLKFYFFTFTSAKKEWGLRNGNFLIVSLAALSGNAGADSIPLSCDALGKDEVSWVSILFYSQVRMEKANATLRRWQSAENAFKQEALGELCLPEFFALA